MEVSVNRKTKAMETIIEERQRRRETEAKTDLAKSVEGE